MATSSIAVRDAVERALSAGIDRSRLEIDGLIIDADYPPSVHLEGSRAALEATGLLMPGVTFAGDPHHVPRVTNRYTDAAGRRYSVSKVAQQRFRLAIYRTLEERSAAEQRHEAERLARTEAWKFDTGPGPSLAADLRDRHSARLDVGTIAVRADTQVPVEIVEPFGLYNVLRDDGPFVSENGARSTYQSGYIVRALGGKPYFLEAFLLLLRNGERSHLRLVPAITNALDTGRRTEAS